MQIGGPCLGLTVCLAEGAKITVKLGRDVGMTSASSRINLRDSLRFRLSKSIAIAVMTTLLISSLFLAWISFSRDISLEVERATGVASILSKSIASEMARGDRQGVLNGLTNIRAFEHLEFASVVNDANIIFAEMGISSFLLQPDIDLSRQSPFELLFQKRFGSKSQS